MRPSVGPVAMYGVLYFAGITLHFVIAWRLAKRRGLRRRVWIAVSFCYLLGMTVGAKALYDLRHGGIVLDALLRAEHYRAGGLWGGLLAYLPLAVLSVLILAGRNSAGLDLIAEATPVPWIAAKVGCFLNGCCHGRPCSLPWAIAFPEGARTAPAGIPVHPSQFYEVAIMLIILTLFGVLDSERWLGTKLLWFLLLYGIGRAGTDFLRGDPRDPILFGLLTLTQVLCLLAGLGSLAVLLLRAGRSSEHG